MIEVNVYIYMYVFTLFPVFTIELTMFVEITTDLKR